jgi:hypothetical protein
MVAARRAQASPLKSQLSNAARSRGDFEVTADLRASTLVGSRFSLLSFTCTAKAFVPSADFPVPIFQHF